MPADAYSSSTDVTTACFLNTKSRITFVPRCVTIGTEFVRIYFLQHPIGAVFLSAVFMGMTVRDEVCLKRMSLFFGKGVGKTSVCPFGFREIDCAGR